MMGENAALDSSSDMPLCAGLPFTEFLQWCRRLREAEIQEYLRFFKEKDTNNSGKLDAEEMRKVITDVGYMPLKTMMDEVMAKVDKNGDGDLDFDEFVNLMAVFRKTDGFSQPEIDTFKDIFSKFTGDDDKVDCLELMDMLRNMGYCTNLDVVR